MEYQPYQLEPELQGLLQREPDASIESVASVLSYTPENYDDENAALILNSIIHETHENPEILDDVLLALDNWGVAWQFMYAQQITQANPMLTVTNNTLLAWSQAHRELLRVGPSEETVMWTVVRAARDRINTALNRHIAQTIY